MYDWIDWNTFIQNQSRSINSSFVPFCKIVYCLIWKLKVWKDFKLKLLLKSKKFQNLLVKWSRIVIEILKKCHLLSRIVYIHTSITIVQLLRFWKRASQVISWKWQTQELSSFYRTLFQVPFGSPRTESRNQEERRSTWRQGVPSS